MKRPGLLTLEDLQQVLDREETTEAYVKLRDVLFKAEPTLAANVIHWVNVEKSELNKKFPAAPKALMDLVGHLLERYVIRGWMLQRKAYGAELDGWINKPEGG